jgi:hypothetical protein
MDSERPMSLKEDLPLRDITNQSVVDHDEFEGNVLIQARTLPTENTADDKTCGQWPERASSSSHVTAGLATPKAPTSKEPTGKFLAWLESTGIFMAQPPDIRAELVADGIFQSEGPHAVTRVLDSKSSVLHRHEFKGYAVMALVFQPDWRREMIAMRDGPAARRILGWRMTMMGRNLEYYVQKVTGGWEWVEATSLEGASWSVSSNALRFARICRRDRSVVSPLSLR